MGRLLARSVGWLLGLVVSWPLTASALTFNPNLIINDEDMTSGLFSLTQTVSFLRSKAGYLGSRAEDFGQTIYDAAVRNGLNPQFLIVQIQKESSLIEDPSPRQHQIDFALGFGCPDNGSCNPTYRGFGTQVTRAAEIFREYLTDLAVTGRTISGWGLGLTKRTGAPRNREDPNDPQWEYRDGQPVVVTPANAATAALYTYNPWVGGHSQWLNGRQRYIGANYNFRLIWERYFVLRRVYPDGSLLRVRGDATVWLIKEGQRHAFTSASAFLANYDWRKVISVPAEELERYERGPSIRFAEYSLLQAPNGGIYLLANAQKRPIVSRSVFRALGYNPEEVVKVRWQDLEPYPTGKPITTAAAPPTGQLVQLPSGAVVFIDSENVWHPILSREIYRSQFRRRRPEPMSFARFNGRLAGEPIRFADGELVTAPGADGVFLISSGQKRPIASGEAFVAYRFRWRNVIRTTPRALEIHPTGPPLDLQNT